MLNSDIFKGRMPAVGTPSPTRKGCDWFRLSKQLIVVMILLLVGFDWPVVTSFSCSTIRRPSLVRFPRGDVGSYHQRHGFAQRGGGSLDFSSYSSSLRQEQPVVPSKSLKALATSTSTSTSTISSTAATEHHHSLCTCCDNHGDPQATKTHRLRINVAISGVFWFICMLAPFLPAHYSSSSSIIGNKWHHPVSLKHAGLVSVAFGLPPIVQRTWQTLRKRHGIDANGMMLTAALGALALGEFGEAASVAFLFSVGHYLESRTTSTANKALMEIVNLRQEQASLMDPISKEITVVPADQVMTGDLISVRVGERIAADGVVVEGTSTVDQSSLTGESIPVRKSAEDDSSVLGGSINSGPSPLVVRATKDAKDSAISKLIQLVQEAQARRSPKEKMIDRFSKIYTPITLAFASLMSTIPWFFGRELGRRWTLNGLIFILLACPCALLISTPVTYTSGLATMARHGVVVKGGETLEALGSVDTVLLDKTGTITKGEFSVQNLETINGNRRDVLELLALMEAPSSHPLSAALVDAVGKEGIQVPTSLAPKDHTVLDGEGVKATVNGRKVYVGNQRLFQRLDMYDSLPDSYKVCTTQWKDKGGTVGFMGEEGKGITATFCITDEIRDEAKETIEKLLRNGINVSMLTGDTNGAALKVGQQVGIPNSNIHAQLTPEEKLKFVTELKEASSTTDRTEQKWFHKTRPSILFCGDGINDAPVATASDVGVSLGDNGAALTIESSDATLMKSDLTKLPFMIHTGKRVLSTIRENIAFTLACKLVAAGLTLAGRMTLLSAVAADVGILLLVTLNSLKLLPTKHERA